MVPLDILESKAGEIQGMFRIPDSGNSKKFEPPDISGMSITDFNRYMDPIFSKIKSDISFLGDGVKELESFDSSIELDSISLIGDMILVLGSKKQEIDSELEYSRKLVHDYNELRMIGTDFNDSGNILDKINELKDCRDNKQNAFGGFGKVMNNELIGHLSSEISSLFQLHLECYDFPDYYLYEYYDRDYETALKRLFTRLSDAVFYEYDTLAYILPNRLKNDIDKGLLDSLRSDYASRYAYSDNGAGSAPGFLSDDYLLNIFLTIEKKKLFDSLVVSKDRLVSCESAKVDLSSGIAGVVSSFDSFRKRLFGNDNDLSSIDIKSWDIFRNSSEVQDRYGLPLLSDLDGIIRDDIFNHLLTTPKHTNESIDLGHKAVYFNDPMSVAYNILNFWRELGYSGEMPFLSTDNDDGGCSIAELYMSSLSDEQLESIVELGIPGLVDLIEVVKSNPKEFIYRSDARSCPNQVYERVHEALGMICYHFLENGTDDEKYFVSGLVNDATFLESEMHHEQRDAIIESLCDAIGLDVDAKSTFKGNHYLFKRQLNRRDHSNDLKSRKDFFVCLSGYVGDLEQLMTESNDSGILSRESEVLINSLGFSDDYRDYLRKSIEYLNAFESDYIQSLLADNEYGEVYRHFLNHVRNNLKEESISSDDVRNYVIGALGDVENLVLSLKPLIDDSDFSPILKKQLIQILTASYRHDLNDYAYLGNYLIALDDMAVIERFGEFEDDDMSFFQNFASTAHSVDRELVTPLTRKVICNEQSRYRIHLLTEGLDVLRADDDFEKYILSSLEMNKVGYKIFSTLAMSKPVLDERFFDDVRRMFNHDKSISDYCLDENIVALLETHDLSGDSDILSYCELMSLQGKEIRPEKISSLVNLKSLISGYETQLEVKPDNAVISGRLEKKKSVLDSMIFNLREDAIYSLLKDSCCRALEKIVDVPVAISDINDDLVNAILLYSDIRSNHSQLSQLLRDYVECNPQGIYGVEKNQAAKLFYESKGIDMDLWIKGISREYQPDYASGFMENKKKEIERHYADALGILSRLDVVADEGRQGLIRMYDDLKSRPDIDGDVLRDLKTQIDAIKSIENATIGCNIGTVEIYAETDPLKILQMGNVVYGSCLGLGRGNSHSAVANAVDINKSVLYAKMNGEIIGRKLIALNDDGQIVQYHTYNNRLDLDLDNLFKSYLGDLAKSVNTVIGNSGSVSAIVADSWYDDGIVPYVSRPRADNYTSNPVRASSFA